MKLEDHVKQSIHEYPGLFKDVDYARSRMKVLSQLFVTIGNGYELAMTTDPTKGGYLIEPESIKVKDEWVRQPDPPYGEEKYEGPELDKAYFDTPISRDLFKDVPGVTTEMKGAMEALGESTTMESCSKEPYVIEQICHYSFLWEMTENPIVLQPDWIQGAVDISKEALSQFSDPEKHVKCCDYPSPSNLYGDAKRILEYRKKSEEEYLSIRELWGYSEGQTVLQRKTKHWVDYLDKALYALVKFLCQYDVPPLSPEPPVYDKVYAKAREDMLTTAYDPKIVQYIVEGKLP